MFSWPALFGAALAIWLVLRGPAVNETSLGPKSLPRRDSVFPVRAYIPASCTS